MNGERHGGTVAASTPDALDWRCRCGALAARVALDSRRSGRRRAICHCRDCQAFQHALGTAEKVLDAHGGTDIAMTSPASFAIVRGGEHLALLRLYPKGLLRWYAGCCGTPLGNTPQLRLFPHLGLITATLVAASGADAVDRAFGPVRERIFGAEATSGPPPGAHPKVPLAMLPPVLGTVVGRLLRGEHRRSPFFDAAGRPAIAARVLADAERAALPPYRAG